MLIVNPMTCLVEMMVALVAGFVKGLLGFVFLMISISELTLMLPPHLDLAPLNIPTFSPMACEHFVTCWQPRWRR
jgi:hypothetical protein